MDIEALKPEDLPAVTRIWREAGWLEDDADEAQLEHFFADATAYVARIAGEAECAVSSHRGVVRYGDVDLSLAAISSVTTSRIARKRGLARDATASLLADVARDGAQVAMLGMFEQGFYDRLGFGTGTYDIIHRFDPATLRVPVPERQPVRFTVDDAPALHRAMRSRRRGHGAVALDSAAAFRAELAWRAPPFGLGFRDEEGEVSSFLWGESKGEFGPYEVGMLAYRSTAELLDLLGLLRSLGDQVRSVQLIEPVELQLQDLLDHPGRQATLTRGSTHWAGARADAWWQVRVLDVGATVAARRWGGGPVRFVLELSDPLADGDGWPGVQGTYRVEVGDTSIAEPVSSPDTDLPIIRATVNAFSRLWFGVRPATSLALTDAVDAPSELLRELDEAFRLPEPRTGMDF